MLWFFGMGGGGQGFLLVFFLLLGGDGKDGFDLLKFLMKLEMEFY